MPSAQSISACTPQSSIHFRPYTFLYGRIWIELQSKSAHTKKCMGGNELKIEVYGRIWIELQSKSARTKKCTGGNELNFNMYRRIWIEHWATGKLNSHHFTFLKFQNPSSGSEVTVNSKYYYP